MGTSSRQLELHGKPQPSTFSWCLFLAHKSELRTTKFTFAIEMWFENLKDLHVANRVESVMKSNWNELGRGNPHKQGHITSRSTSSHLLPPSEMSLNSISALESNWKQIKTTAKHANKWYSKRWPTSACRNSWRKAAFQCNKTYGTFVKPRVATLYIVP
jgi:hypothetical protein